VRVWLRTAHAHARNPAQAHKRDCRARALQSICSSLTCTQTLLHRRCHRSVRGCPPPHDCPPVWRVRAPLLGRNAWQSLDRTGRLLDLLPSEKPGRLGARCAPSPVLRSCHVLVREPLLRRSLTMVLTMVAVYLSVCACGHWIGRAPGVTRGVRSSAMLLPERPTMKTAWGDHGTHAHAHVHVLMLADTCTQRYWHTQASRCSRC
jgi:hypothetical protein